jgi:hypothetical protein
VSDSKKKLCKVLSFLFFGPFLERFSQIGPLAERFQKIDPQLGAIVDGAKI